MSLPAKLSSQGLRLVKAAAERMGIAGVELAPSHADTDLVLYVNIVSMPPVTLMPGTPGTVLAINFPHPQEVLPEAPNIAIDLNHPQEVLPEEPGPV